jgi:hypothetical protein
MRFSHLQGNSVNTGLLFREPQTHDVAIFFGDDFEWADAAQVFPTLDGVIAAFNAGAAWSNGLPPSITLSAQYSTPRTFLAALASEQQKNQPVEGRHLKGKGTFRICASSLPWRRTLSILRLLNVGSRSATITANKPLQRLRSYSASPATGASGPGFPVRPAWDMLPHGFEVDEFQWWTGFITSRPECECTRVHFEKMRAGYH